jgi:hypothetical protein
MQCRLSELFTGLLVILFGKIRFKSYRLIEMKRLKISVFIILIEAAQSFCDRID